MDPTSFIPPPYIPPFVNQASTSQRRGSFPLTSLLFNTATEKNSPLTADPFEQIQKILNLPSLQNNNSFLATANQQLQFIKANQAALAVDHKLFAHIHGDIFLGSSYSTSLSGNVIDAPADYLVQFFSALKTHRFINLDPTGVLYSNLDYFIALLNEYASLARLLANANNNAPGLEQYCNHVNQRVALMGPGHTMLIPGGWKGHVISVLVEKIDDNSVILKFENAGAGRKFHNTIGKGSKLPTHAYFQLGPINRAEFSNFNRTMAELMSINGNAVLFFNCLLSYVKKVSTGDPSKVICALKDFVTGQRGGVCPWQTLMCLLHSTLPFREFKILKLELKKYSGAAYLMGHESDLFNSRSGQLLFKNSLEKLARSALKKYQNNIINFEELAIAYLFILELRNRYEGMAQAWERHFADRLFQLDFSGPQIEIPPPMLRPGEVLPPPLTPANAYFSPSANPFQSPLFKDYALSFQKPNNYMKAPDEQWHFFLFRWYGYLSNEKKDLPPAKLVQLFRDIDEIFKFLPLPRNAGVDDWSMIASPQERDGIINLLYQLACLRLQEDDKSDSTIPAEGKILTITTAYAVIDKLVRLNDPLLMGYGSFLANQERIKTLLAFDPKIRDRLSQVVAYFEHYGQDNLLFRDLLSTDFNRNLSLLIDLNSDNKTPEQEYCEAFLLQYPDIEANIPPGNLPPFCTLMTQFTVNGWLRPEFVLLRNASILAMSLFTQPPGQSSELSIGAQNFNNKLFSFQVLLDGNRIRLPSGWKNDNEVSTIPEPLDKEIKERGGLAKIFPAPMTENEALLKLTSDGSLSRQFSSAKYLDLLRLDQTKGLSLFDLFNYFTLYPEEIKKPYLAFLFTKYLMRNPTILEQLRDNPSLLSSLKTLLHTHQTASLLSEEYSTTVYLYFFEFVLSNYEYYITHQLDEGRLLQCVHHLKSLILRRPGNASLAVTVTKIILYFLLSRDPRIPFNTETISGAIASMMISNGLDVSDVPLPMLQQASLLNSRYYDILIDQAVRVPKFLEEMLDHLVHFLGYKECVFDLSQQWMPVGALCYQKPSLEGYIYEVDLKNSLVTRNSLSMTLTPSYILKNESYRSVFGNARFDGILNTSRKTFEFTRGLPYTLYWNDGGALQVRYENGQYEHRASFSSGNQRDDYLRRKLSSHYSERPLTVWAAYLEFERRVLFINAQNEVIAKETLIRHESQWVSLGIQKVSADKSEERSVLVEIDPNNFHTLSSFAPRSQIFLWREAIGASADPRCVIEFRKLNLSFEASRNNPRAISKQYPGYGLSQQQTIRSFPPNFRNYIVLDKVSRRILLLPFSHFLPVRSTVGALPFIKDLQLENVNRHLQFELNYDDRINFGSTTHNLYLAYIYLGLKEYSKAFEYLKHCSLPTVYNDDCKTIFYWISDLLTITADTHPDALFLQLYAAYLRTENNFRNNIYALTDLGYWQRIAICLEDYVARYPNQTLGQLQINEAGSIEQTLVNLGIPLSDAYQRWKKSLIGGPEYSPLSLVPSNQAVDQLHSWNPQFSSLIPSNADLKNLHETSLGKQIIEQTYKGLKQPMPAVRLITRPQDHLLQNFWSNFRLVFSPDAATKGAQDSLLLEMAIIQSTYEKSPPTLPLKRDPTFFTCYFWSLFYSLLMNYSGWVNRNQTRGLNTLIGKLRPGMTPEAEKVLIKDMLGKASHIMDLFFKNNHLTTRSISFTHEQPPLPVIAQMNPASPETIQQPHQKDTARLTFEMPVIDMNDFLIILSSSPNLGDLNVDLMLSTENLDPRIQQAFRKFNERALTHTKRKITPCRLKNVLALEDQLRKNLADARRKLSDLKFQVVEQFNRIDLENEASLLHILKQQGGKLKLLDFNDLVGLFLNGQLRTKPNLQSNILLILLLTRRAQSFERALELVEDYQGLGSRPNSLIKEVEIAQKISEELSTHIPYNLSEHPEILVFECIANRRVYPYQIKDFKNFFESNPYTQISSLRWLIQNIRTGRGKSSVLLALLCYLIAHAKAQPSSQPNDRAKKNLSSLPIIIVPEALVPSTLEQLHKNTLNNLGQAAFHFKFSRKQTFNSSQLNYLCERLHQTFEEKGYILTSREDIQALQLAYIEILFRTAILSDSSQLDLLDILRKMLLLFKEHGIAVLDEADFILHDRFELHYSLGDKISLEPEQINLFRKTLQALFANQGKLLKEFQKLNYSETKISEAEFRARKLAIVEELIKTSWDTFDIVSLPQGANLAAFAAYLAGYAPPPNWIDSVSADSKNLIALVKGQMSILFPLTLNRQPHKHFGFSKDPHLKIAIPFHEDKPSENALHQNPYEGVIYTILAYMSLPEPIIAQKVLAWLKSEIQDEIYIARNQGIELPSEQTKMYRKFHSLFPSFELALIEEAQYEELGKAFLGQPEIVFDFLQRSVLRQISIFPTEISINGVNFIEMFAHALGFAATTSNASTFHPRLECDHAQNSDVDVVALVKDSPFVSTPEASSVGQILEKFYTPDTKIFIDSGSYFKETTDAGKTRIAREFLSHLAALPGCKVRAVAYHNDNNELVNIKDLHSAPKPFQKPEIIGEDVFILLWPAYIAGTDFAFHDEAEGIVTLSSKMDFRSFIQAVGRMRGLEKGQKVKFMISTEEANIVSQRGNMPKTQAMTLIHTLSILKENEEEELNRSLVHSTKQMLNNLTRREIISALLQLQSSDAIDLFKRVCGTQTDLLLQDQTPHPWRMYGEMPTLQETERHLLEILEGAIAPMRTIFTSSTVERILKEGKAIIQNKIREALLPASILKIGFEHDRMQQVQVSTEQDQQLQQADKALALSSVAKPWKQGEPLRAESLNLNGPIFTNISDIADDFNEVLDFLAYLQTFCGLPQKESNAAGIAALESTGKKFYQRNYENLNELKRQVKEEIEVRKTSKRLYVENFRQTDAIDRIGNVLGRLLGNMEWLLTWEPPLPERKKQREALLVAIKQKIEEANALRERFQNNLGRIEYPSLALGTLFDPSQNLPTDDFAGLEISVNFLNVSNSNSFMSHFPNRWNKPIRFVLFEKHSQNELRCIILSSEEFDFIQKQLKLDRERHRYHAENFNIKFCLYHLNGGYVSTGLNQWSEAEVLNDPSVQLLLLKMKMLNGVVHYSAAEIEALKSFIRNHKRAAVYEKFFNERIVPLHTYKEHELQESALIQVLNHFKIGPYPLEETEEHPAKRLRRTISRGVEQHQTPAAASGSQSAEDARRAEIRAGKRKAADFLEN